LLLHPLPDPTPGLGLRKVDLDVAESDVVVRVDGDGVAAVAEGPGCM